MPDAAPDLPKPPWWRRKWVTIGEIVGVAALAIAALTYLQNQREHHQEDADKRAAAQREVKREALVLTAEPVDAGARLLLHPLRAGQAVQTQRYLFPRAVLDHAMEVSAAQPQIQAAWVREGLKRELEAAARADGRKLEGEGDLPVGVVTTYVEDGETRTDRSLYRIGYRVAPGGLFAGARLVLLGLAVSQRGVAGDLQATVEARWKGATRLR